ncbi:MAG: acyltransferase [Candidatus Aminicenantes bacterium]|nr:acyltransferase [Candidatus Aminicenantes bacterium]
MSQEFFGSTQKEILDESRSIVQKYMDLFIGKRDWLTLLRYELLTLLFSSMPGALGFALRRFFFRSLFRQVGQGTVFGRNLTLRHPHKIKLGRNCVLDDFVVLDAKGKSPEGIEIGDNVYIGRNTVLSCKDGSISIGDYSNIAGNCSLLSETQIKLGKYVFVAGHCYIVAGGNHRFDDLTKPIMFQPSISKGGVIIEDDVWLGAGCLILDGVTVGRGSVIAAGTILTQSVPEYSVVIGSRSVRRRDRREILEEP